MKQTVDSSAQSGILLALDAFIRKYYKNLLIKGLLYTVAILATMFLLVVIIEHLAWLPSWSRAILFWGGLAGAAAVLIGMVIRPLFKMYGISYHRISRMEAARIIGNHFPEVSDRMLNLLQLMKSPEQEELMVAAINQKESQLRPIPILNAINLKANKRFLWYALPPLLVVAVLWLVKPSMVNEPVHRIVNYNTYYQRPAPFEFRLLSSNMMVSQGEDFTLRVTTIGEASPAEVYLVEEGHSYIMRKVGDDFIYTWHQVNRNHHFYLEGGGVRSEEYEVVVLSNPSVLSFSMQMVYPSYTGRKAETLVDMGDALVPEGTVIRWAFQTSYADILFMAFDSMQFSPIAVDANGRVALQHRMMQSANYQFFTSRCFIVDTSLIVVSDTLSYSVNVVPDAAPLISVEELMDSLHPDRRIFRGSIQDDYGFTSLVFKHELTPYSDTSRTSASEAAIALGEGNAQDFFFTFNMAELDMHPGDAITYYFEVSDNDAIHGPKTTRSRQFEVKVPTADQIDSILADNAAEAEKKANMSMSELQRLQEEINQMMRRLVDKKELSWQDKKDLERIAQKQREVREMVNQMQQQMKENERLESNYQEHSEQLVEKQRELDRLMNEVFDEQMKQTMAEIDKLMKEMDKKNVQQELEKLKDNNAELEKQLDQNLELMKRLELEKKVEQTVQKMQNLAEQQRNVSRETEQGKPNNKQDLLNKQNQIDQQFQQLKNDVKEIEQEYKQIDPQSNFHVADSLQQQVQQEQQQAKQQLQKGKNKNASQHQKQAADKMDQMANAIEQAQLDAEQEELAEDAEQVRQLLKSLVGLSMNQEQLISDVQSTYIQDPKYQNIIALQHRIGDDFHHIDDSLRAMAKRQIQVASAISTEVQQVNNNISTSLNSLLNMNQTFYAGNRNTSASRSMQFAMTSLNNLSLVLAESLDQMQNQMRQNSQKRNSNSNNRMKSNQQCSNPGSNPSPKSMRQMQQELNKQLEAMKKQLDKEGKPNQRHQVGQQNGMSEQFSKMAAQQELIRRMMQEYGQEMKQQNAGNSKLAKEIDQMMRQMEQVEADLVNRTITQQTLQRQKQIMSRMLEHEKAEMQREREERRESHEGSDLYDQPSPAELEKYLKQSNKPAFEQLRTLPPTLSPYYRQKVNDYFYRISL